MLKTNALKQAKRAHSSRLNLTVCSSEFPTFRGTNDKATLKSDLILSCRSVIQHAKQKRPSNDIGSVVKSAQLHTNCQIFSFVNVQKFYPDFYSDNGKSIGNC